jgi:hypothetical protein
MKMSDYGVWALGQNYKSLAEESIEAMGEQWYSERDTKIIPSLEQIKELGLYQLHFWYYVHGEETGVFRLLIDEDGSEPFELEIWDNESHQFRSSCLVTRNNLWEKMSTTKIIV